MTTNVADQAVIRFIRDYTDEGLDEPRNYQISDGSVRTSKPVGVSNRKSIEFFLIETVDMLEVVREAIAGGWTAAQRFRELKECLRGDALGSYIQEVSGQQLPRPSG